MTWRFLCPLRVASFKSWRHWQEDSEILVGYSRMFRTTLNGVLTWDTGNIALWEIEPYFYWVAPEK